MKEGSDESPFELQKGAPLVHSKYNVISKLGNGTFSTVHSISLIKGKKQIIRAVKVVPIGIYRNLQQ